MNCSDTKNELSAYMDEELSEQLTMTVQQHLSECPACRTDLDLL